MATLIIPTVSTGNVPQLAIDLLIFNFGLHRLTTLDSTFLYPFASPVDYPSSSKKDVNGDTSSALELHTNEASDLFVLVQRAPVIPRYVRNFIDYLDTLIKNQKFKRIIVLDSTEAVVGRALSENDRVKVYSDDDSLVSGVEKLGIDSSKNASPQQEYVEDDTRDFRFSEFAKILINSLALLKQLDISALVIDVYEGDNFQDAFSLARHAIKTLQLPENKLEIIPKSWEGVYGDMPLRVGPEGGVFR